jgi:hypothetical protein
MCFEGWTVMDMPEDRLALAKRLIVEGRRFVELQRTVVYRRELAGLDNTFSEEALQTFELSLAKFEAAVAERSLAGRLRLH